MHECMYTYYIYVYECMNVCMHTCIYTYGGVNLVSKLGIASWVRVTIFNDLSFSHLFRGTPHDHPTIPLRPPRLPLLIQVDRGRS